MKIAIFKHDLTHENLEDLEDEVNDFSLEVEVVDIKTENNWNKFWLLFVCNSFIQII